MLSPATLCIARVALLVAALPLLMTSTLTVFYREAFAGRIYPHVDIGPIALAGRTPEEARALLERYMERVAGTHLRLRYGDAERVATLSDVGATVATQDVDVLVARAWQAGREDEWDAWLRAQRDLWHGGERLPLPLTLEAERARTALEQLAQEIDVPPVSAQLELLAGVGTFEARVLPAAAGQRLNVEATLERLEEALRAIAPESGDDGVASRAVDLAVEKLAPAVTDERAEEVRATLTHLAGEPVTFVPPPEHRARFASEGARTGRLEPEALLSAVRVAGAPLPLPDAIGPAVIDLAGAAGEVGQPLPLTLDEARMRDLVRGIAAQTSRPARNPLLALDDGYVRVQAGDVGWHVDEDAAVRDTVAALSGGARTVELRLLDDESWVPYAELAGAAAWANARLAAPLALSCDVCAGEPRWTLTRDDLSSSLILLDTQALPRPAPGEPLPVAALAISIDRARVLTLLEQWVPQWTGVGPDRAPSNAGYEWRAGQLALRAGRAGIGVDLDALADEVIAAFHTLDPERRTVRVEVEQHAPRLTASVLEPLRDAVERLAGQPVVLFSPVGEWQVEPGALIAMLEYHQTPEGLAPQLNLEHLMAQVSHLAHEMEGYAALYDLRDLDGQPWRVDVYRTAVSAEAATRRGDRVATVVWAHDP